MQNKLLKTISILSVIIGVLFISYSLNLFNVNASNHTFGPGNTQGTFGSGNTQGTFGSGNTQGTFGPGTVGGANPEFGQAISAACKGKIYILEDFIMKALCIIVRYLIPLIFAFELIVFIFGVIKYVLNSDNETEQAKGKKFMLWGLIAIFVTVAIWGLVAFLQRSTQIGGGSSITPVQLNERAL